MIEPLEWLKSRQTGFRELQPEEIDAITSFPLLWSLFESLVMERWANLGRISGLANRWAEENRINTETFAEELAYFRNRYFQNGDFTENFRDLHLEHTRGAEDIVAPVLKGESTSPAAVFATVFLIIYRFRNNLFHGEKWQYLLRDQRDNFTVSNQALMKALDLSGAVSA